MAITRSQNLAPSTCLENARPQPANVVDTSKTSVRRPDHRQPKRSDVRQKTASGRIAKSRRSAKSRAVTKKKEDALKKPRRRSSRSLKVKLSGIDYDRLNEAIKQLDYKLLRQQKRLENFKGRYYPPTLNKYKNRYQFKFDHNPFYHTNFKAPGVDAQWKVYELMKQDLKENFNKECFLDQPDATTNELQEGPMHMSDDLSIDNLVKVILSISTENSLAIRQHAQLCSKFTYTVRGKEVKGTVPNYHRMRICSPEVLVKALNVAGHHNLRQRAFHSILQEVYHQNIKRLAPWEVIQEGNLVNAPDFVPGLLSMDYLKGEGLSKQERFDLLVKFDQIAVKTGCCLLAFNLKIPVFVVDTHVHNMVRILNWIPEDCHDADKACMFLDKAMPDRLKFGLHQAFWHHRINCVRCMPRANPKSLAYQQRICPLEEYVNRELPSLRQIISSKEKEKHGMTLKLKKKATESSLENGIERKQPGITMFLKMHYKKAEESGYVLRKVVIDDDFGDGSRQNKDASARYYWGRKEDTHANDMVPLKEALEAINMTAEEYEARFIKKAKAQGVKRKIKSRIALKGVKQEDDGDIDMMDWEDYSDTLTVKDDDSDDSDYDPMA